MKATCSKRNCHQPAFMDTSECFDHQTSERWANVLAVVIMLVGLAVVGVVLWAIIQMVNWVTGS